MHADLFFRRYSLWLSMALVIMLAVALHAYVLTLPLFWDDMFMLLRLHGMPWGKLLTSSAGYMYYRPLYMVILKLPEAIFGWPDRVSLRALTIAFHAANSVLAGLLAAFFFEGQGRRIAAAAAGLLFAAYPFTYEVTPLAANIYQPVVTFLGTGAALCYLKFRLDGGRRWLWVSLLLALLGSFMCEYGAIISTYILLIEAMFWWSRARLQAARFSRLPLVYFALTAAYLTAWLSVEKSRAAPPLILQGLEPALRDMPITALYYLQGLTYPLQTLAWPLIRAASISRPLGVGIVALTALAVSVALFGRVRRLPLLIFALAWFAIAVAPAWPMLNADYTLNGPRLLYWPSFGAAMLWGMTIALLWARPAIIWRVVSVLVLVAALAQSVTFLYGMADLITIGARLTADVARTVAAAPPDEPILIVNFPAWIGKHDGQTMFALGSEGMSFLPGYSSMRDLVLLNTHQDRSVTSVTFTNTIKEWKYDQRLSEPLDWNRLVKALRAARHVWMVEYLPDRLRLSEAGFIQQSTQPEAERPEAIFGEQVGVRLVGYQVAADELRVELAWTTPVPVHQELAALVHLYNSQGALIAQHDGYPLLGLYPPWIPQQGQIVYDVRHITLPPDLPAGHYTVGVGLYDLETGQRVTARSPSGARFENDVYLIASVEYRVPVYK